MESLDPSQARPNESRSEAQTPWPRLAVHAIGLVVVLLALLPLVEPQRGVFDADEGGNLLQIDVFERTAGATDVYWGDAIDPAHLFVPIEHAVSDGDRIAPMPFRPALVLVLWGASLAAGIWSATALGCVGVGVAAFASGAITNELGSRYATLAVWTLGLLTPLTFDAFVLRGHSIGAALCGLTALAALRSLRKPAIVVLLAMMAATAAAVMIRKEALFLAGGIALAFTLDAALRRRWWSALAAGCTGVVALGAVWLDSALGSAMFDVTSTRSVPAAASDPGFLIGRLQGLWNATFRPGYEASGNETGNILLLIAIGLGLAFLIRARRQTDARELVLGFAFVLGLLIMRTTTFRSEPDVVPSLFLAAPLIVWGLACLRSSVLREDATRFLAVAVGAFWIAVMATQYPIGGAWEWGTRYLEVGLPLAVPLVIVLIADLVHHIADTRQRAAVVGLIAACALVMSVSGLVAQREARLRVEEQIDRSLELAATTESGVVISTFPSLPRSAVDQFSGEQRWLWVWPDGLTELVAALDAAGIDDAVLVSHDEVISDQYLATTDWTRSRGEPLPANPGQWTVSIIEAR